MLLSPNFTLEELTFSQIALRLGIDNTPPPAAIENLKRLCADLLEPARTLLQCPLHVDSGYRSGELNHQVGGAGDSRHMLGCAADVIPMGMDLRRAFDSINASALIFDQLILECDAWIHLGMAPPGTTPRRELLLASGSPGHWTYVNA